MLIFIVTTFSPDMIRSKKLFAKSENYSILSSLKSSKAKTDAYIFLIDLMAHLNLVALESIKLVFLSRLPNAIAHKRVRCSLFPHFVSPTLDSW